MQANSRVRVELMAKSLIGLVLAFAATAAGALQPEVSVESVDAIESRGYVDVPVTLSQPAAEIVSVFFSTSAGTAVPGEDFYGVSELVSFEPGETRKTVKVTLLFDNEVEEREVFNTRLHQPVGAVLGAKYEAVVVVSEAKPTTVNVSPNKVDEDAGRVRVAVSLSAARESVATVNIATAEGSATKGVDYYGTHQVVTFMPAETIQDVYVELIDDVEIEKDEQFSLRLFNAVGVDIGDATASVSIRDNDGTDDTMITVNPGDDIVELAAASPEGARFRLTAGVHQLSSMTGIKPRNGQHFVGDDGAIIDGNLLQRFAFYNKDNAASDVLIKNLEIRHFVPKVHWGAIEFDTVRTLQPGQPGFESNDYGDSTNWTLQDLWVHSNDGDGIDIGSGARLLNVRSNNNAWLGIGGHGEDIVIDGGELIGNSSAAVDEEWLNFHAGGMKLTRVKNITVANMYVAENYGPGLWFDLSVRDATINNNLIVDNVSRGIFYEISYGGMIRDNVVIRSGTDDPVKKWITPAGILISTSTDVHVHNNYVAGALGGISVIDQRDKRADDILIISPPMRDGRPYRGRNTKVTANIVCSGEFQTGVATDAASDDVFDTSDWQDNQYHNTRFRFRDRVSMDFDEWRSFGLDTGDNAKVLASCPEAWDPRQ